MSLLDEVYASNPSDKILYTTLELLHSAFDYQSPAGVIRLCSGFDDLTATLEAGAPFDPAAAVVFTASGLAIRAPNKGIKGRQEMTITLDAVSGEVIEQLEQVIAAPREPIKAILRYFVSSDLSEPQNIPYQMTVINPSVSPEQVTARAVFTDVLNKSYPAINYTLQSHPGLA
tara:strand:- start:943 stop:1461 length:519 start_codon:yes stop_codon:yes gene_type:complete